MRVCNKSSPRRRPNGNYIRSDGHIDRRSCVERGQNDLDKTGICLKGILQEDSVDPLIISAGRSSKYRSFVSRSDRGRESNYMIQSLSLSLSLSFVYTVFMRSYAGARFKKY